MFANMDDNKKMILVLVLLVAAWWFMTRSSEGFDGTTSEFVPVGDDRYGLRGDMLRRSDISRLYIRPDRQVRLHHTNNPMYESNFSPEGEGPKSCRISQCPSGTEYDATDRCYTCEDMSVPRTLVPFIHPHTKN